MKKIYLVTIFLICLYVSFLAFDSIGINRSNILLKKHNQIETKNGVTADQTINILKLPLPNTDLRKYSVKKLPINGSQIEVKKLNNQSLN
ncbi:hypothetical protein [Bacillus sp. AFS055030]|uniref:hypothetical protein n=1 Tax=Bacillus sp. AFS055030 TaxID=2033507 RepID=UPI000BFC03EB|nr:hypothetical protein [Bacillus sp. AFS055030]PGL66793.1 hypothetical protein CN925_21005 [Bacillus sp. AFS055030]